MTLPAGPTITLNQINGEFGRGYDLNAYRGVRWWYDNAFTGTFPSAPNSISMNAFYSTRSTSPVSGATYGPYAPGAPQFTVPVYTVLTFLVRGAGGGGSGYSAVNTCAYPVVVTTYDWDAGGTGGNTFVKNGTTVLGSTATGGAGGASGGGAGGPLNDGGTPGGGGGANGFSGGYATYQLINPVLGGTGPNIGDKLDMTIGSGGGGGAGARIYSNQTVCVYYPPPINQVYCATGCVESGRGNTGNTGANGSVTITVS